MKISEIIVLVLTIFLEIWRNRTDPDNAKIKAAAAATKDLNDDQESFKKAIKENDAATISAHFESLRDRVYKATGSGNRPSRP